MVRILRLLRRLVKAVGVNDLFNATIVNWGMIMAAGVMIAVPTIAFIAAVGEGLSATRSLTRCR